MNNRWENDRKETENELVGFVNLGREKNKNIIVRWQIERGKTKALADTRAEREKKNYRQISIRINKQIKKSEINIFHE